MAKERFCAHCGKLSRCIFDGVENTYDKYCKDCFIIYHDTMIVFENAIKDWKKLFDIHEVKEK